ncbi:MAG: rRNA maturation RNase YbeY, partial [Bacteriovoracaceae bacterium]|nr:rRNA maturation RNase YbeY [Bacteriovoracaceae bacterium]
PVLEAFLKNKKKGWALSAKVECSLLLCGMKQMQKLNKLHRKKDKVTDVISFPCYESFESSSLKKVKDLCLGDIVICVPQAKKQAPQFGIAWQVEMIYLFTHGFLHLCGWDHERSLKEEKKMNEWEAKLVSAILSKCHKEYL